MEESVVQAMSEMTSAASLRKMATHSIGSSLAFESETPSRTEKTQRGAVG